MYFPGDKVLLRTRKSLVNEFGLQANGTIQRGFVPDMMEYCGMIGTVIATSYCMCHVSFDPRLVPFMFSDDTILRKV